jgi:hypothetical protein
MKTQKSTFTATITATITASLVAALAAFANSASAQSVKAGLWEATTSIQSGANQMQMEEMRKQMAKMTPEQKKQFEEAMAKSGVKMDLSGSGGIKSKVCMTKDDIAASMKPSNFGAGCTGSDSRSGNTLTLKFSCTNPQTAGEAVYTFNGDERYTMRMKTSTTVQGKTEVGDISSEARWLGADCQGLKPISQVLKK